MHATTAARKTRTTARVFGLKRRSDPTVKYCPKRQTPRAAGFVHKGNGELESLEFERFQVLSFRNSAVFVGINLFKTLGNRGEVFGLLFA